MPCRQCENGKWKWGDGPCEYDSKEECERANHGKDQMITNELMAAWPHLVAEAARLGVDDSKSTLGLAANKRGRAIELLIYGVVGDPYSDDGVTAKQVANMLAEDPTAPVQVRINSPGGLAFQGLTIHNALVRHKGRVIVEIEGIAASAAAIIAVAGDRVRIWENASFFIHRAMGIAVGNAVGMEDMARFLGKLDRQIARTLASKTGKGMDEMMALLTGKVDGTVFEAKEAVEAGFADEVIRIRRPHRSEEDTNGDADGGNSDGDDSVNNVDDREPVGTIPADPENASGQAQPGRWRTPWLQDFTRLEWGELLQAKRESVAAHFAYVMTFDEFQGLLYPHHFPPNRGQGQAGKPSLTGVRHALKNLAESELPDEVKAEIRAHLQAHLPREERRASLQEEVQVAMAALAADERTHALARLAQAQLEAT